MTLGRVSEGRTSFEEIVRSGRLILTEGSIIERLAYAGHSVRGRAANAHLLLEENGRNGLRALYREYLELGEGNDLPLILFTPTWRANPERLLEVGLPNVVEISTLAVNFLHELVSEYGEYAEKVYIGGLMGCRGDAYKPEEALAEDPAFDFHSPQAQALADAGVDFLMAATLPQVDEAVGIARAMTATGIPSVPSYVIRRSGALLDGTPLHKAVKRVDESCSPQPSFHMVNCVHPSVFQAAMEEETKSAPWLPTRLLGLQANSSARSPEELDGLDAIDSDEPAPFATAMYNAQRETQIRIVGGCCGTNTDHLRAITEVMIDRTV